MPPSPRQHLSPSKDHSNVQPSWRTTWKIDSESGKHKLVVTPCISGRTPLPIPKSVPEVLQTPRGNLPQNPHEQRTPGPDRDTETPERTVSAPPYTNFFDWSSASALPQRSLSLVCGAPNAKRRVWLPSHRGLPRAKIHFLSSGIPGVRVSQFIRDPTRSRIMDNYSQVCTIRKQYGIRTVKVMISWPGYDDFRHTINLMQVLCMGDLLHELCRIISKFRHHVSTTTCRDPLWRLGPGHIAFEDIWITGFGYSHCGHWAPAIEVEV
ncbi:hypothetical protein NLI96_g9591 [Meripilus lineatus]|uniref:Uncharacterized protein n=1 Tax=Meripilus lineatus TaxID=2056292 RepID=A0AAD5UV70_9APHY|nr:hypothetical protein NLI96_g9591 [Physisporinus lineatus]